MCMFLLICSNIKCTATLQYMFSYIQPQKSMVVDTYFIICQFLQYPYCKCRHLVLCIELNICVYLLWGIPCIWNPCLLSVCLASIHHISVSFIAHHTVPFLHFWLALVLCPLFLASVAFCTVLF